MAHYNGGWGSRVSRRCGSAGATPLDVIPSSLYRHPGDDVSVSTGLVLVKFK